MKPLNKILSALLGLALLGALVTGAYFGFKNIIVAPFTRLGQPISLITGIASMVLLLSAFIIASGMRWAKERESELRLRAEKALLYENFLNAWVDTMRPGNNNYPIQLGESQRHLEQQLLLRASPNVLKAYVALRKLEIEARLQINTLQPVVVKMLIEMRKDLGLNTQGLKEEDLLSLVATNSEKTVINSKVADPAISERRVEI